MTTRADNGTRSTSVREGGADAEALDASTARALKLWVVLARAYSAMAARVDADIAQYGLTTTEFGILEVLRSKGPLLLGEIQRKVLVTSGGITYLVDRLLAKGLVRREPSPSDRRARYAVLTPEGRELIERHFPAHAEEVVRAVGGLSAVEQVEATALLRKLGLAAAERTRR